MARLKEFNPEEKLTQARNLFWSKGYHATSMQEIVQATGLSRASIYDTFGDKQTLFRLCLENYLDFVSADNSIAIANINSPLAAIDKLLERVIIRTHKSGHACMGVKSSLEIGLTDANVNNLLKKSSNLTVELFSALIQKAKDLKEIDSSVDPEAVAKIIQYFISGLGQQFSINGSIAELKKTSKDLMKIVK